MVLVAVFFVIASFVGLVAFVVRVSGRRYPGDITGPQGREIDYDNPYPGWNIWSNQHPEAPSAPPRVPDDFEMWESEQRRGREV